MGAVQTIVSGVPSGHQPSLQFDVASAKALSAAARRRRLWPEPQAPAAERYKVLLDRRTQLQTG